MLNKIKITKIFITIIFCATNFFVYGENNENVIKYCAQKYYEVGRDYPHKPLEILVNNWKRYEKECSVNGIYEYNLADIYGLYGKHDIAENILLKTIETANYDTKNLEFLLGIIYGESDNLKKYKNLSDKLINKYPNWFGGYYHLAILNNKVKPNYFTAEKNLLKALELVDNKNSFYVLCSLASVEYHLSKLEKMTDCYLKAAESHWGYTSKYDDNLTIAVIKYLLKIGDITEAKNIIEALDKFDLNIINNKEYLAIKAQLAE